jgi:hypothetical protein
MLAGDSSEFWTESATAREATYVILLTGDSLAAAGFLNPLLAAFIHVASEMAFILNSTRLLPARRERSLPTHKVPIL